MVREPRYTKEEFAQRGNHIGIAEGWNEYEWGGHPAWLKIVTGKMPVPRLIPIPQNSSNHSMIKQRWQ